MNNKSDLVKAINWELKIRKEFLSYHSIETIYFGGGTPSILNIKELSSIIEAIHSNYKLHDQCEVTIECNPEDINKEYLSEWHNLGINRLSIGIQSFKDEDLNFMNRAHDARTSYEALRMVQASKFENFTADLMFGLIDQSLEDWTFNLTEILNFNPPHLSIYNLTIEEQTVFANWKLKNRINEIPNSMQEEQFYVASQILQIHGFDHYEISNYAQPGYRASHNTNYWRRIPYLGVGPSAHSFKGNYRSWNVANNNKYLKAWRENNLENTSEVLNQIDHYNEMVMLGLRTKWGINQIELSKFSDKIKNHFNKVSRKYMDQEVLIVTNDAIKLDHNKWYLSDHISSDLFFIDNINEK